MRQPRFTRLSTWLAGSALVVALVPALLLAGVALQDLATREEDQAATRSAQLAQAVAGELGRLLDAQIIHLTEVRLAADLLRIGQEAAFEEQLKFHLAANSVLRTIILVDRRGRVAFVEPLDRDLEGTDLTGQPWLREAWTRAAPTWSPAVISAQTGQPTVTLVVPGLTWTIVGYLDLPAVSEIVTRTRSGSAGGAMVLDRDGTIIAHHDPRPVREHASLRGIPLVMGALAGAEGTAIISLDGEPRLASVATVAHTGWVVLVAEPVQAAFAKLERSRLLLLLVLGAGLAMSALAARFLASRILQPVQDLGARSHALAAGEPVPPAGERGPIRFRELEELAASFDAMAQAVRARQEALVRSERSFRALVDTPLVAVLRATVEGEILFANQAMAQLVGAASAEALLGRVISDFYVDPNQREVLMRRAMADGRITNQEVALRRPDGQVRTALINVGRDGDTLAGMAVDITDIKEGEAQRERLEQQLERAQRVEAVGRLAGGVAHDLNNVLTAIVGYAHMLADALPEGHRDRDCVEGIMLAAGSATALTRSLLAFSRKHPIQPRPVDVSEVVRGVEGMLRRLLREDVEFVVDLPAEPLVAVVDPARLEQVLVNLGTNASDAIPGRGVLTIAAAAVELTAGEAAALGLETSGRCIRLTVRDTGQGMSEEVQRQAFEPFFTTKAQGKGTGLGLSIVHGIVRQHGGAITLQTAPGAGTTFTIHLPASVAAAIELAPVKVPAASPGGRERILVAEDEEAVRRVVVGTLERAGYRVIETADGAEAVTRFHEHRGDVDLCLLDVIMPHLNGREVLEAVRRLRPDVRVLLMSGFTGDVLAERGLELESVELLQKPMTPADLLARVRAVLDRA